MFIEQFPPLTSSIFTSPSMFSGDKEESSPLHVDNLSYCVISGNNFILLPVPYDGLDGVLFDARHI